jgi:hypothetical protein
MSNVAHPTDQPIGDLGLIPNESDLAETSLNDLASEAIRRGFLSLEDIALIAYRQALITRGMVGEILGLSFQKREDLLKERDVPYNYDMDDFEADQKRMSALLKNRE